MIEKMGQLCVPSYVNEEFNSTTNAEQRRTECMVLTFRLGYNALQRVMNDMLDDNDEAKSRIARQTVQKIKNVVNNNKGYLQDGFLSARDALHERTIRYKDGIRKDFNGILDDYSKQRTHIRALTTHVDTPSAENNHSPDPPLVTNPSEDNLHLEGHGD